MKKKINWNKEIIKEKVSKVLTIIWRVLLIIILCFILVGYVHQCSKNVKTLDQVTTNQLVNRDDRDNYLVKDDLIEDYTENGFLILYTNEGAMVDGNIVDASTSITKADGGYFEFSYNIVKGNENFTLYLDTNFYYLTDVFPFGYYNSNNYVDIGYYDNPYYYDSYSWTFDYDLDVVKRVQLSFNLFNDVATNYYIIHLNITPKLYNSDDDLLYTANPMQNLINTNNSMYRYHFPANSPYSILNYFTPSDFNINTKLYNVGYQDGYNQGEYDARDTYYDLGYDDGYDDGYHVGTNDSGIAENGFITMFNVILTAPFNIFNGLLNFELFGVNLFNVFSFIITAFLVIWIIKRFV